MALDKFNWQNGSQVEPAKVEIEGVSYDVVDAQYEGETPLSASNLNLMQDTILGNVIDDLSDDTKIPSVKAITNISTASSDELRYIKFGKFVFIFGTVVMNAKTKTFTLPFTPNHTGSYPVTGYFSTASDVGTYGNLQITNNSTTASLSMNNATTRAVTSFVYLTDE